MSRDIIAAILELTHLIFGLVGVLSAELMADLELDALGGEGEAEMVRSLHTLESAAS